MVSDVKLFCLSKVWFLTCTSAYIFEMAPCVSFWIKVVIWRERISWNTWLITPWAWSSSLIPMCCYWGLLPLLLRRFLSWLLGRLLRNLLPLSVAKEYVVTIAGFDAAVVAGFYCCHGCCVCCCQGCSCLWFLKCLFPSSEFFADNEKIAIIRLLMLLWSSLTLYCTVIQANCVQSSFSLLLAGRHLNFLQCLIWYP